jgi:AcrR family transcriptional regulator
VSSDRSSATDRSRSLRLLWRIPGDGPRHGPKQGLSIDAIITVATALADAESLDAVTMRKVAHDLRVAPMTLYTYVRGKAELVDLMLDAAYSDMFRADTSGKPWRERLTAVAEENRTLFLAHPWAATIALNRPPLGPGLMTKYEHELSAFDGLGLDDIQRDSALTFLLNFAHSNARDAAAARAAQHDSTVTDEQWWAASAPLLAAVFDEHAYPLATRVGTAAGSSQGSAYDPEFAYSFGLLRVLDGLAALIEA